MPFSSDDRRTKVLRVRKNGKHKVSGTVRHRATDQFRMNKYFESIPFAPRMRSGAFIDSLKRGNPFPVFMLYRFQTP